MRPLFPVLPFVPDETPLSWATRQAAFHTGGRLAPFLNDFDLRLFALARCKRSALLRLCDIAGQDPEPVLRNTISPIGQRRYRLRDEEISAEFTTGPITRYCPLCLQEDRASETRPGAGLRHRLAWKLAPVRTCTRHGLALVEVRNRKWDDFAHELQVIVPRSDADLDRLAAGQARRTPSPLQAWVLDRLAGRSGPGWLDGQGLEQAVRATEMLGAVLAFGPDRKVSELTGDMWDEAGRAGWEVTSAGEAAIGAALTDLVKKGVGSHGIARPRECYGLLFNWLSTNRLHKDPGPIREILREHILDSVPIIRGRFLLGKSVSEPRVGTVATVAAAEGLHTLTLRNILVAKGVVPVNQRHEPCGRIIVRHAEVDPIVQLLKNAVPVVRLPDILDASRPLVGALLELGHLRRIQDQSLLVSKWGKAVERADIDALRTRLERDFTPVNDAPEHLVSLAKAAEKTRQRLTRILELLFAGRLTRARRLEAGTGFAAILVDPMEIKSLVESPRPGMCASLAFMMLGVSSRAGRRLIAEGEGGALLQSDGKGPDPWISPEALADFRRTFAVKKRLPLETGLKSWRVDQIIEEHQVPTIYEPRRFGATIYRRSDLPEALTS